MATILWCQHISTTHEPVIGLKTGWSSRDMYQSVSCIEGDGINLKLLVNSLSAGPKVIGHSSSVHSLLDIPSSKLTVCYGKWSIEIDDLPTKNGDFPVRKLLVYREKCYMWSYYYVVISVISFISLVGTIYVFLLCPCSIQ